MAFDHRIEDVAGLRRLYADPHATVRAKAIDHLDAGARAFLARSPFGVLATSGPCGGDASPRGGPPGFAAVLDDHRLAMGDLATAGSTASRTCSPTRVSGCCSSSPA
jgi:uncharacterized protein